MFFLYARLLAAFGIEKPMKTIMTGENKRKAIRAALYLASHGDKAALQMACSNLEPEVCDIGSAINIFKTQKHAAAIQPLVAFLVASEDEPVVRPAIVRCVSELLAHIDPGTNMDHVFEALINHIHRESQKKMNVNAVYLNGLINLAGEFDRSGCVTKRDKSQRHIFSQIFAGMVRLIIKEFKDNKNLDTYYIDNFLKGLNNMVKLFPLSDRDRLVLVSLSGKLEAVHLKTPHIDQGSYEEDHAVCGTDYCEANFDNHTDEAGSSWRPAKLDF